jgi:hypothetical protein
VGGCLAGCYDAILRHVSAQHYEVPQNLRRFLAGKPAAARPTHLAPDVLSAEAAQITQAEAGTEADCCGADTEQGCGCR